MELVRQVYSSGSGASVVLLGRNVISQEFEKAYRSILSRFLFEGSEIALEAGAGPTGSRAIGGEKVGGYT